MTVAWLVATGAGLFVCIACAVIGRWLLWLAGIRAMSLFGGAFVFGYGLCGLILLLSVRFLGSYVRPELVLLGCLPAIACASTFARRGDHAADSQRGRPAGLNWFQFATCKHDRADVLAYGLLLPWILCVGLVYFGVGRFVDTPYCNFPDIFDLPKQLLAQNAAFHAAQWPAPNPFYGGEPFTYNLLFYFPMAVASKLAGSELANFQTFSIAAFAMAAALPLTLIDVVRTVTTWRWAPVSTAVLATWAGGLTPLFVTTIPALGWALYREEYLQDKIWIDETFLSAIYVPQHIFAVLCALVSMLALALVEDVRADWKSILVAGSITAAGALASLILLPLMIASYGLNVGLLVWLRTRRHGLARWREAMPTRSMLAAVLPVLLLLPFVLEARNWSSDIESFLVVPRHPVQWLYVLAALGLVVPMSLPAMVVFVRSRTGDDPAGQMHRLVGVFVLAAVGFGALLFAGYPEAGIKSGLWVRLVLVVPAAAGLELFTAAISSRAIRTVAVAAFTITCVSLAAINLPLIDYYVRSAFRPLDPGIVHLIADVRHLDPSARLVLLPSDQVIAAMMGRRVDFNFFPLRNDGYLPPESRDGARAFWNGLEANDLPAWRKLDQRYDYAIVARGSFADRHLAADFALIADDGAYLVYRISPQR